MWTAKVLIGLEFFWESWVPEPRKTWKLLNTMGDGVRMGGQGFLVGPRAPRGPGDPGGGGECSHSLNEELE